MPNVSTPVRTLLLENQSALEFFYIEDENTKSDLLTYPKGELFLQGLVVPNT